MDGGSVEGCGDRWVVRVTFGEFQLDLNARLFGLWLHETGGGLNESRQVRGFEIVAHTILIDAGVVEDVFDQRAEASAFLKNKPEVFLLFVRSFDLSAFEAFGHQLHGGEWGAQLMGDAGDKIALLLVEMDLSKVAVAKRLESAESDERGEGDDAAEPELAFAVGRVEVIRVSRSDSNGAGQPGGDSGLFFRNADASAR